MCTWAEQAACKLNSDFVFLQKMFFLQKNGSINFDCHVYEIINLPITVNSRFKKSIFPLLNRELFDLRKIFGVNLKTSHPKKMPYVGEFST